MDKEPTPNESKPPQNRQIYEIPVEGSLGLLALGHVGLKLWREKRREVAIEKRKKLANKNNSKQK